MYNSSNEVDQSLRRLLNRIGGSGLDDLVEYLNSHLSDAYVTLKQAPEMRDVYRYQGRIAALEDFLEDIAVIRDKS